MIKQITDLDIQTQDEKLQRFYDNVGSSSETRSKCYIDYMFFKFIIEFY